MPKNTLLSIYLWKHRRVKNNNFGQQFALQLNYEIRIQLITSTKFSSLLFDVFDDTFVCNLVVQLSKQSV